jgi:hypothetical protein
MTPAEKILQKALVGSTLDSRQWNGIQAALRDRAFISSTVAEMKILHASREMVAERAAGKLSASEIRRDLRKVIASTGYDPGDARGTIKDLYTKARLDTIIKTNVAQARGFVQRACGMTPGAFGAFPAQELYRLMERKQKRDWAARWNKAYKKVNGEGALQSPCIALKTSPIWTALSAFGHPYPPFDWGSGMDVRDVSADRAIELGLISRDELKSTVRQMEERRDSGAADFNKGLQMELPSMRSDSPEAQRLKDAFGDQIKINNGVVEWQNSLIQGVLNGSVKKATFGRGFDGSKLSLSHQFFLEHGSKHLDPSEPYAHLTPQEFELLPSLWRKPDRIIPTRDPNRLQLELDLFDGGILLMIVDKRNGLKSIQKRIRPGGSTV